MKHDEGTFRGADDLDLFYQRWLPEAEPRAVIGIVHGVGESSSRYANLVNPLIAAGYAVYGCDQRGHGRSPGQPVYIKRWSEYREDLGAFVKLMQAQEPGRKLFLYGHSMGALVTQDYLLHSPDGIRGAVLSGTPFEPAGVASPALVAVSRLLTGILPRMAVNLGLDLNALSRDPAVAEGLEHDPTYHRNVTVRWGTETLNTNAWVNAHLADFKTPLLLLHGEKDRLNLAQGTRAAFEKIGSPDKTLLIVPGGFHEPHNDIDHEKTMADVRQWLDKHV